MVRLIYGKWYDIFELFVDPEDLGHLGASRARLYLILAHKHKVVQKFDCRKMYEKISLAMKALVQTRPSDYYVAEPTDLKLEAERVARVQYLDYLLNTRERAALNFVKSHYQKKFNRDPMLDKNLIVFLGDNPKKRMRWSGASGRESQATFAYFWNLWHQI
ncbi:Uncharacterized protein SCF082_LOCUS31435 [Durusdinium trenchii]|uniref:Uncharacterized protein n=1 Tax=Durusdinium trenchii TaxID=1381693 RepID=A0ABP0N6P2_9DINO